MPCCRESQSSPLALYVHFPYCHHKSGGKQYSHCFGGSVLGSIAHQPIGEHGFGYDPIFIPQHHRLSFAQMTQETKNTISHRARSFQLFRHAMLP